MNKLFPAALLLLSLTLIPSWAYSADMYLILDKTQVAENGNFSGTVYISTGGLPINSAEGTIHFPADLVSVTSVSNSGSIFNIWVEQPTFSNTEGVVNFDGGLPTPGYSGQSGSSLRINFKAKKAGLAKISFGSSAVRADDGNGTNVLTQTRDSSITITGTSPVPVPPPKEVVPPPVTTVTTQSGPSALVITSDDMPDQNSWYNKTEGTFAWDLPVGVNAVQLILSRSADSIPNITYDPPIKNKTLSSLADGVFYLNGRFKNSVGWGKIASRKIKIDTVAPENISVKTGLTDDDLISIEVSAKDGLSGLKNYVVYEGDSKLIDTPANGNGSTKFNLPPLSAGSHKLSLRAYDGAGNYAATEVTADAPEVKAPRITHYPESIKVGSSVEIRGKSAYADSQVVLWFKEDGREAKSYLVKSDEDKVFTYTSDDIRQVGVLNVWAESVRRPEVKSLPTGKVYISVKESDVVSFGTNAIQVVSVAITCSLLVFGLLLLIYLGIRRINSAKRKLRRDLVHTEQEVSKVFEILKGDTRRHLRMLEKASSQRKLTKEESKIMAELSENLEETERYLAEKAKATKKTRAPKTPSL